MVRVFEEARARAMGLLSRSSTASHELLNAPTNKNIIERGGKLWLPIKLGGVGFQLPLVHITENGADLAIAWFDPSEKHNRLLAEKARDVMADQLEEAQAQVVFMTNSSKSEWFIKEAIKKVNKKRQKNHEKEISLFTLPSGRSRGEVEAKSEDGSVKEYEAITGKKYMGLPKGIDKKSIDERCPDARGLVIVDDIKSRGGTSAMMRQQLGLREDDDHQLIVIGVESPINEKFPPDIDRHTKTSFFLPEFPDLNSVSIDRAKLFPHADRNKIPLAHITSGK